MTREERLQCIEQIRNVDTTNHATEVYDDFYSILDNYDCYLADELLDNYESEANVIDSLMQMGSIADIQNAIEGLDPNHGIYHDYGWNEYEDADMDQLKQEIINQLENMADEDEEDEEEDDEESEDLSVDNNEDIWVEEDDNFLTKEK